MPRLAPARAPRNARVVPRRVRWVGLLLGVLASSAGGQETGASTYVDAVRVEGQPPRYPVGALQSGREGWVMLSYVVSAEGEVIEPMIEDSSGHEVLEKAALDAVRSWKYRPAQENGTPVEQSMVKSTIRFVLNNGSKGVTEDFRNRYRRITRRMEEGSLTEAGELIAELEFEQRFNLYEDAWFWWLKYAYLDATQSTDRAARIQSLQRAVGYEDVRLDRDLNALATQRLFVEYVQSQDYAAAMRTFERFRDLDEVDRGARYDEMKATMEPGYRRMAQIVSGSEPIVVSAVVGIHDYWVRDLLRRSFAITDIRGRLDVVDIRCERGTRRDAAVEPGRVWSVPPSWGKCGVYIKGVPGSAFKFEEYGVGSPPP